MSILELCHFSEWLGVGHFLCCEVWNHQTRYRTLPCGCFIVSVAFLGGAFFFFLCNVVCNPTDDIGN